MTRLGRQLGALSSCTLSIFVLLGGILVAPTAANSPLRYGVPGRRIGGGTRCPSCISQPQIALTSETNLTTTARSQPVLLFYLPAVSAESNIEFVLKENRDNVVYSVVSPGTESSGIVRIDLSELAPSLYLEENIDYSWFLSIVCDSNDASKIVDTSGVIRYVRPADDLSALMTSMPSLMQVEQLMAAEFQIDALVSLDSLRRERPDNLEVRSHWRTLLSEILGVDSETYSEPLESLPIESPFASFFVAVSEDDVRNAVTSRRTRPARSATP